MDKNPLAVEMAKLSLWLITLDKHRSFTFLDHALKHGDSLIGADEDIFLRWSHTVRGSAMPLFDEENRKALAEARARRRELQSFEVRDVYDAERKAHLLAEAEGAMARIKQGCDVLVGARLLDDLSQAKQDALLEQALIDYTAGEPCTGENAQRAVTAAQKVATFHWPFEFPEVFEQGGFSGFVGNPPFIGGRRIRETLGDDYREALYRLYPGSSGNADYCVFFFLRGFVHLRKDGTLGLIATNTIAQGDTRQTGLDRIVGDGGTIYNATNDQPWPGQAAVVVDIVHITKGKAQPLFVLDNRPAQHISCFLDSRKVIGAPHQLAENKDKSHMGSNVVGIGFAMSPQEAQDLIRRDSRNADVLFSYINGQDLNSSPSHSPGRQIINLFDWPLRRGAQGSWLEADKKRQQEWLRGGTVPDDYPDPVAYDYPDCMAIVRAKVYPGRIEKEGGYARYWWQYGRRQERLYEAIAPFRRTLAIALTSNTMAFAFVPTNMVFSHAVIVLAFEESWAFAILQSTVHTDWARRYGSSMKGDARYTRVVKISSV